MNKFQSFLYNGSLVEEVILIKDIEKGDVFINEDDETPSFYQVVEKDELYATFRKLQTFWIRNKKSWIAVPMIGSFASNKKHKGESDQLGIKIFVDDANVFLKVFEVKSQTEMEDERDVDPNKKPTDSEETVSSGPAEEPSDFGGDDFGDGSEPSDVEPEDVEPSDTE